MKIKHLFLILLATSTVVFGCKKAEENGEDTKESAMITFTAKYGESTEGITKPEGVVLTIDNNKIDLVDGKFSADILKESDTHLIGVYSDLDGVSMDNGVLAIGSEGAKLASCDWIFAYAANKKIGTTSSSLSVTLKQQTKQINVIVRSLGGKANIISEATAELTAVAAQRDLVNNTYKASASASATLPAGNRPGSFYGLVRVLGFMPDADNALNLNFTYSDGTSSTTTVDLSGYVDQFNEDKTVIDVVSVSILDLGGEGETSSVEVTSNGTLENVDNSATAPAGDKKLTINWPSYNTAGNLEVLAGGLSYFGALGEATEAGQTTTNGFAELPTADQIEEIAIYLGTERFVAPVGYYEYADGVITMTDCKLVYKSEQLTEDYITAEGTFVQTCDLVVPTGFAPLGTTAQFTGCYDGQGFAISGMNFTDMAGYQGLFSKNYGTIKNVVVKDSKLITGGFSGAIAGRNYGDIINCESYLTIEFGAAKKTFTGGITGHHDKGLISGCKFHGTIIDKEFKCGYIGGISGGSYSDAIIENCLNTGKIETLAGCVGGIAGRVQGIVRACKNIADLNLPNGTSGTGNGGVVGRMDYPGTSSDNIVYDNGRILACVNTGNITGTQYFGGLCGVIASKKINTGNIIQGCYSTGLIIDGAGAGLVAKAAGWFIGRNQQGFVKNCFVTSEGQPATSNKVFGNGNIDKVDIQIMDGDAPAWPEADNTTCWGVWTEGCDPTEGYYWKDLGASSTKSYPKLYWEE